MRKHIPVNSRLDKCAKDLRKRMTEEERTLWYNILRGRKPKFHRQKIIGNYIVDFYCPELQLIIEVDGTQHYQDKDMEYDYTRTEYFQKLGLYVLRFDNAEVRKDFEYVKYTVDTICRLRAEGHEIAPDYR